MRTFLGSFNSKVLRLPVHFIQQRLRHSLRVLAEISEASALKLILSMSTVAHAVR